MVTGNTVFMIFLYYIVSVFDVEIEGLLYISSSGLVTGCVSHLRNVVSVFQFSSSSFPYSEVVITCALHAQDPQFEPGRKYTYGLF